MDNIALKCSLHGAAIVEGRRRPIGNLPVSRWPNPSLNERVNFIKYLGLYIDFQLNCNVHIDCVVNLSHKLFYVFKDLRFILDKQQLRIIYISLVQSIINLVLRYGKVHTISI